MPPAAPRPGRMRGPAAPARRPPQADRVSACSMVAAAAIIEDALAARLLLNGLRAQLTVAC